MEVTDAKDAYLAATAAEVASWREVPMTRAFIDWVDREIESTKDATMRMLLSGAEDKARLMTGAFHALEAIKRTFARVAPVETEADEPFFDSAMRPAVRKAMELAKG